MFSDITVVSNCVESTCWWMANSHASSDSGLFTNVEYQLERDAMIAKTLHKICYLLAV